MPFNSEPAPPQDWLWPLQIERRRVRTPPGDRQRGLVRIVTHRTSKPAPGIAVEFGHALCGLATCDRLRRICILGDEVVRKPRAWLGALGGSSGHLQIAWDHWNSRLRTACCALDRFENSASIDPGSCRLLVRGEGSRLPFSRFGESLAKGTAKAPHRRRRSGTRPRCAILPTERRRTGCRSTAPCFLECGPCARKS